MKTTDSIEAKSILMGKNALVGILFLFVLWLATFYPVLPEMVNTWLNDSNNSHGILVPLVSAFIIWQKRKQLATVPISTCKGGAVVMSVGLMLYVISYSGAVAVLTRVMIVVTLIGVVLFNLGMSFFSVIQFPLYYLFFMVPVPDSIYAMAAFPLQQFATKVSALLIRTISIPVLQEGNMLYFAETQLEVVEACSGLRSMMSFIMLSFLFAYMMKPNWRKRMIIVFSAIPLAIFANVVRVTGTGILAHYYGGQVARGFLHEFSGLTVFALGFVLLLGEYFLLEKVIMNKAD